ncbi:MAG: uroporphyrinogen-III C-methyltransferase, partial [Pseudomonadales bacterium]|nr:uroporphyrinogen-III C-methyltransferase [Pseudomonadales bacterium]
MDYLPVFLDLRGRTAVVVGGGTVALHKARLLTAAGARLRVVAPRILLSLEDLVRTSEGELIHASFEAIHLDSAVLVVCAVGERLVDVAVKQAATQRHIPVNIVDVPELCDFILPAIVDRSPVIAAFSTGGSAPLLASRLRMRLEALLPANYGRLASYLGERRELLGKRIGDTTLRLRVWERIIDGAVAERVLAADEAGADRLLEQAIAMAEGPRLGEVYLVGAGPGDPDLLSVRALRLMQKADVVLHDRLVSTPILELVRRDAERVFVGKRRGQHAVAQPDINDLLVSYARMGKRVLRLKGGDPFIFGRGGEEIEHLAEAGIPFQVVPGITAASGCAAYAGIPLTHRDYAQSVQFVTGHLHEGSVDLDWRQLVGPRQTLVLYVVLLGLPSIC